MSISGRVSALVVLTFSLLGCSHNGSQSYADAVLNRPLPADDEARTRECAWIRSEIARQESLAGIGTTVATTPLMAAVYRAVAQRNVAALESRAANIRCTAAFSNQPASTPPIRQSFEQCFARCQQYTDRTKDQCFDACNK